ncbi:MAG: type IV pilus modification protein PilV [Magnetococcales bacterium]|nr:type IV pilus modification protein PilV [Magnetococcales bacterium]
MSVIRAPDPRSGFTLLEVLITLVIVAVGLLGLAKLQLNAIRFTQSAQLRTQALLLGHDILERMRTNRTMALNGAYTIGFEALHPDPSDCQATPCTPAQMAAHDLTRWKQDLASLLPDGDGEISRIDSGGQESLFHIAIRWDDDRRHTVVSFKTFSLESEL